MGKGGGPKANDEDGTDDQRACWRSLLHAAKKVLRKIAFGCRHLGEDEKEGVCV